RLGAVVHPSPRPLEWGRLHDFALDCMRFALEHVPFDALTVVDSDQLGLRPGYSDRLAAFLADNPGVGMLGSCPDVQRPGTTAPPAAVAHAEYDLWRPFLRQFPDGESKFVHWTFWPSTVFTEAAARGLVRLFDGDPLLADLLRKTRVWATEEVILPTLVGRITSSVAHTRVFRRRSASSGSPSNSRTSPRAAASVNTVDGQNVQWTNFDSPSGNCRRNGRHRSYSACATAAGGAVVPGLCTSGQLPSIPTPGLSARNAASRSEYPGLSPSWSESTTVRA